MNLFFSCRHFIFTSILLIAVGFSNNIFAQTEKFAQVEFTLQDAKKDILNLMKAGLDLDHCHPKNNKIKLIVPHTQLHELEDISVPYKILYFDYANILSNDLESRNADCQCISEIAGNREVPTRFRLGSMRGYFTYEEISQELSRMQQLYPSLITFKRPIGNFLTFENRPLEYVVISDNPYLEENEKKVLYTALHHAREPMSLSQMIYYMWYLLENYESSDEIKQLINQTAMYFVPCVNPDGYQYNCSTNPNGGGMWRKNRSLNTNNSRGVDLNRNYGYGWGRDNVGSSNMANSEVYRGPRPFSEPETQAIKWLSETNKFEQCLNYHSYGNLLVHPSNFLEIIPDSLLLDQFASLLSKDNHYNYGSDLETVGYSTNGSSDDWLFAETLDKERVFSFTPEVGCSEEGFWPPTSSIIPNCHSMLETNLKLAKLAHSTIDLKARPGFVFSGRNQSINVEINNFGSIEQSVELQLTPISSNISSISPTQNILVSPNTQSTASFEVSLTNQTLSSEVFKCKITGISQGIIYEDTIVQFVLGDTKFEDNISSAALNSWIMNPDKAWSLTTETYHSAPNCITDSPNASYVIGTSKSMTYKLPTPVSLVEMAELRFWAKWDLARGFDYAQVLVSHDGLVFTPITTTRTKLGSLWQANCEPIYDDLQKDWVMESYNLNEYIGGDLYIKVVMESNQAAIEPKDGFYIDDIEVIGYDSLKRVISTSTLDQSKDSDQVFQVYPNPVQSQIWLKSLDKSTHDAIDYSIYDATGRLISKDRIQCAQQPIDCTSLLPGLYFIRWSEKEKTSSPLIKFVKK